MTTNYYRSLQGQLCDLRLWFCQGFQNCIVLCGSCVTYHRLNFIVISTTIFEHAQNIFAALVWQAFDTFFYYYFRHLYVEPMKCQICCPKLQIKICFDGIYISIVLIWIDYLQVPEDASYWEMFDNLTPIIPRINSRNWEENLEMCSGWTWLEFQFLW